MTKSKSAFLFSSRKLGTERLFLWTFTFKELLSVKDRGHRAGLLRSRAEKGR